MLVLNEFGLICKWRAVYIERCKHGSGASIRKPAVVTWQGAECLAYFYLHKSNAVNERMTD
jgi:hypothetical protein